MDNNLRKEKLLKYRFYFMSLWLLFVLIFILTVDISIDFSEGSHFIGFTPLNKRNVLAFISLLCAILGLIEAFLLNSKLNGVVYPPYKINAIKNLNYEYLSFITTYIIPLICFDLTDTRYVLVLVILLIVIGFIHIRMGLYYGNPTLALMGYRLYRAEIKNCSAEVVLISKDFLTTESNICWLELDKNVWLVKENK